MWGKKKDGQPYIKFKKKGISGQQMKTEPTKDIHFKEHKQTADVMREFAGAEVIVPDADLGIWFVWFGGESHYVHLYNHEGKEVDVFSWGFEKNKLDAADVRKHIKEHMEELKKSNV